MALEVRMLPPALVLALALGSLHGGPRAVPAQEIRPLEENADALAARARLLQELDEQIDRRRRELAQEEESLASLRQALEAAKQELAGERDRLEALKARVEADIARRERVIDERLDQIAKVYEAMKPREAALALEGMEDDMAVSILERLQGRSVGKIFDLMPKDRVRELTRRLEEGGSERGE